MRRDLAVPALLALLLLLALRSVDLLPGRWLPATPEAFLRWALPLAIFFALLVVPALSPGRPWRVLSVLVAAAPFLAYGLLEAPTPPGALLVPPPGLWIVGVLALVAALLPPRRSRILVIAVSTVLAADVLLGGAGLRLLPQAMNPLRQATALLGPTAAETFGAPDARPPREGLKPGAPVVALDPVTPLGTGRGPFLVPASRGRYGPEETLVLVLGDVEPDEEQAAPRGARFLAAADRPPQSALILGAYEAVVVLPGAWPAGTLEGESWSEALVTFVRRGGLLVGPAPGHPWPEPLGRTLGTGGGGRRAGLSGVRAEGLGHIVRVDSVTGVHRAVAAARTLPRTGTVFDDADARPPTLPPVWPRWRDDPASRRGQGWLLLVYAVVAVVLDRILRGAGPRALGLLAPAAAVALGLVWTSPKNPEVVVHALALDLGGTGGRRVEALALDAGPAGWAGHVRWRGEGVLSVLGARLGPDGRVRVRPRRTAWVVRDGLATSPIGRGGTFTDGGGVLRRFLEGRAPPSRLSHGMERPLEVEMEGLPPPRTHVLRWR